jgi:hypothetical protein
MTDAVRASSVSSSGRKEARAVGSGQQRLCDRVLGMIPFTGITEENEGDVVRLGDLDHPLLRSPGLRPSPLNPGPAHVVHGVRDAAGDAVVRERQSGRR